MNRKQRRAAGKSSRSASNAPGGTATETIATGAGGFLEAGLKHHQEGRLAEAEADYRRALAAHPGHPDALHRLGVLALQTGRAGLSVELLGQAIEGNKRNPFYFSSLGNALQALKRFDEALDAYGEALTLNPSYAEAFNNCGVALQELKRSGEALECYGKALALNPSYAQACNNRGIVLQALNRSGEALAAYDKALALNPSYAEAFNNRGIALQALNRSGEALAAYGEALALKPSYAEAFNNRGIALQALKRPDEALESFEHALALNPFYAQAFNNRGRALQELKRPGEALESYEKALALDPAYAEAFNNTGSALEVLKRFDDALAAYGEALALKPDLADAFNNRGNALIELKRPGEALESYDEALALKPGYAEAFNNRGNALRALKRPGEALDAYDRALALKPSYADALNNRGNVLLLQNRYGEALASYEKAAALQPDRADGFGGMMSCAGSLCDWRRKAALSADVAACIEERRSIVAPFVLLGYSSDPSLQLQCARNFAEGTMPPLPPPLWTGQARRHDKVRIAYLSADFRQHATAHLMAGLFERHDRSRFETTAVSFGADDKSEMRKRLVSAFDRFIDVRQESDEAAAKLLHTLQVDIAVDLMGHTHDSRPGILAYRPAPVQACYLGYPGTMGVPFMDYIIADNIVAPFEHQPFFSEKIVHLPGCYQVNDTKRNIAERTPTRREAGLPEEGFVFCCFNQSWKIAPDMFAVWMRLLNAVEGSVLWLLRGSPGTERNLRSEAQAQGIDPERLVFAALLPSEDHLARHRLAGLFLDTLPCNAHTTASDALWTGLPVVTQMGGAFAGRVAASLLHAAGLPELITHNIADYEALALRLARDPILLESYRQRLNANRLTHPLFDTGRFRCIIETAYLKMWEIWQRGGQPGSFAVEAEGVCRLR